MHRLLLRVGIVFLFVSVAIHCKSPEKKGHYLAQKYCASCHAYPDPSLLDKSTWENKVLPEMQFRMGLDLMKVLNLPVDDQEIVLRDLPERPMVSKEEWTLIKNWYLMKAPDSLTCGSGTAPDTLLPFEVMPVRLPQIASPLVTLIKTDTETNRIYIGTRSGQLFQFTSSFQQEHVIQLQSPPSHMILRGSANPMVSIMGIMDPNDQALGHIGTVNFNQQTFERVADSLQRPVHFEYAHLNNDTIKDLLVCSFGNYTGNLSIHEQLHTGLSRKHFLQYLPGARKVIVKDFNNDGLNDILALMTQGDERIILFRNRGNFNFVMSVLLRFPPVYGSSNMEIADFNNDGKFDILYTNGDNADYSSTLKPYHGIRLFLNNGTNQFREEWFYPLHGASQALAYDFDKDGDLDIAAIAFFPDFKNTPEQGFVYLERTTNGYKSHITFQAANGRWLVMELTDVNSDGKMDILLGALNFPNGVPVERTAAWKKQNISLLLLKNITY